jgi:predicted nucleotidyltransferase
MNQKWNNKEFEIILELIKERIHPRGLSKKLKIPLTTLLRILNELRNRNIIDYQQQGKNKIYELKKTSEAKIYVFNAENYKLLKTFKKYSLLNQIIEKIQKNTKIRLAILFGSYAKQIAKENSDIDIYIDTEDRKLKKEISEINSKLSVKIGEFNLSSLLIKEIIKNHVIIKGVEIYYEKNKFFE